MTKSFTILASLILAVHYISAFHLNSQDEQKLTLEDFISSIERSRELKYFDEMTPTGRLESVITAIYSNKTLWKLVLQEHKELGFLDRDLTRTHQSAFTCTPFRSNYSASSVHKLTPSDIYVVGAVGDSLTAGNGANARTIIGLLIQNRGVVFSVGGADSLASNPTLPNILRQYNPRVIGAATGNGKETSKAAHLDQAVAGANSLTLDEQVSALISRMKSDPQIDYANDWKLITVFMGNNDICDYCEKSEGVLTPEGYRKRMQGALDHLHKEVPRAFVNVVSLLDVAKVKQLNIGITCSGLHYFLCKCAAFAKNVTAIQVMNDKYQSELTGLVKSGRYDTSDDFTVVLQPFLDKTVIPRKPDGDVDLEYFAPDCFHFSKLGHGQASLSLWNSMFEPVGKKRLSWVPGESFECPSPQRPYLATAKNSLHL